LFLLHEREVMRPRKARGFSLLELMIVVAIGFTMAGVAFMSLMPLFKKNHVDQAYDTTLSVIRQYRSLSVTQSKRYVVLFTAPRTITVQYWGVGTPVAPAPVTVATYSLPQDVSFAVQAGFPTAAPDGFGTGTTAIAFNACASVEGGNPCLVFYPDGTGRDDAGNPGNYNNGIVYMTQPQSDKYSSRAITVWGATGRVRGWRMIGQSNVAKWVQQ
jgi:Tfp pilus assembly protein FimT